MQFTAAFGDEETLFSLAGQVERVRPRTDRIPPFGVSTEIAVTSEGRRA